MRDTDDRPDADDLPYGEWTCENCGAKNSEKDAECQFCEEEGDNDEYA